MLLLYREHSHWSTNICKMRHYHQRAAFYNKLSDPTSFRVLQGNTFWELIDEKNKHKHSANHNECAEIFFSTAQRHSGSNVGNLYTKSRQAGGGRDRRVRERNNVVYFMTSLKNSFLFNEVRYVPFHSENPWQSRQKRRFEELSHFVQLRDICSLKTIWPPTGLLMLACRVFWRPLGASLALWGLIRCFFIWK